MSAITDFSIGDGAVAIALTHRSHTGSELVMVDSAAAQSETATSLTLQDVVTKRNSPLRRPRLLIKMYYLETAINGTAEGYVAPPKVAYINTAQTDFVLSKRASVAQVTYLRKVMSNALSDAVSTIIRDAIDSNKRPY